MPRGRTADGMKADDHGSDSGEEGQADVVVCFILPKPLCLSFVT